MMTALLRLSLLLCAAHHLAWCAETAGVGRRCTASPLATTAPATTAPAARLHRRPAALLVAAKAAAPVGSAKGLSPAWGVCGFIGILAQAIGRLAPVALQPIIKRDLSLFQWGLYGGSMAFFAYTEGYKAFQKKFSPLVVQRAMTLREEGTPVVHKALGPFYSMGLFHASKKRSTVSWSITIGVACIIAMVKRLPYPYRSVVDAGVVTGLTWGGTSIALIYAKALSGNPPGVDPELPK